MLKRLIRFRNEVITLWHAFWNPLTPLYLKVLTVLTALYLVSPIDLIADFIPVIGWLDDIVIVPLMVSFIISRLPRTAPVYSRATQASTGGRTIDGNWRRR
jgi:uncharacterized membrane protein YkvA (DUF1232 family)